MPLLTSPQLHPALGHLPNELSLPTEGVLEGAALAALTAQLTALVPLHDLADHDPQQRWWLRLAVTDAVEIWLLGWAPGQATGAHDHDGAHGAITVVHGSLREDLYDFGSGRRTGTRSHQVGTSAVFAPEHAHDIIAITEATTVHAYSPPLRPTRPVIGAPAARG